jgi:hypothetical protein
VTNVIRVSANAQRTIWVMLSVALSEGKKIEEGMTTPTPEPPNNSVAVAHPPEAQTQTPATTEEASDIVTNCKISY